MIKIPEYLPEYKIEKSDEKPFDVVWEELMGWFIIPKLGEKVCWGIYDIPSRKCDYVYDMQVSSKANVHGVEGVEILADEYEFSKPEQISKVGFVAQLTDSHSRYLAVCRTKSGVKNYVTFLDGDDFDMNWGIGDDNCGNETHVHQKGIISKEENIVNFEKQQYLLDVTGRYKIIMDGKNYDTVCVMGINNFGDGVLTENYIDKNGRTVLWRRFNRNDWKLKRYKKPWSEQLPDNEKYIVNGETFVHWYDCISDYVI